MTCCWTGDGHPLPLPEAPFANGGFRTPQCGRRLSAGGCRLDVPNYESVRSTRAGRALPAGHDLAAGAQLHELQFANVESLRQAEGEPAGDAPRRRQPRAASPGRRVVVAFNDRGRYRVPPEHRCARRGVVNGLGVVVAQAGLRGTNVNELTHQRLTDIGAARCFYDCLVEVAAA